MLAGVETRSGEPDPQLPRYLVESVDFLSTPTNLLTGDVKVIDFDQCFSAATPPDHVLGTALDFLALEVAVGGKASPKSDIWALGCCIFRLRSGSDVFSTAFMVDCPMDLVAYIGSILGKDLPSDWVKTTLWDENGYPTKNADHGVSVDLHWDGKNVSLPYIVDDIWDEPLRRTVSTGTAREGCSSCYHDHRPFNDTFSNMVWKPQAVNVDNVYIYYYDHNWLSLRAALPRIPDQEADLLVDLLSKIFVNDPEQRPTAYELLEHPWFHLDDALSLESIV